MGFLARFSGLYAGRFLGRGGWLGLRPLDGGNPDDQCVAHAIGSNVTCSYWLTSMLELRRPVLASWSGPQSLCS